MTKSALIDPKFLVALVNEGTVTQNGKEASARVVPCSPDYWESLFPSPKLRGFNFVAT